ncbi:MAG: hypothetical protein WBL19_01330 [Minisyncoccia bacterium]
MISNPSQIWFGFSLTLALVGGAGHASAQCATQWLAGPGVLGTNGSISAMTMWDPDGSGPTQPVLVVGGLFTVAGSVSVNNIATYDLLSGVWSPLGSGMSGDVRALTVLPNGNLVAGGSFLTAGGVSAIGIARWDGTSWWALGAGVSHPIWPLVDALATLPNGHLVAGGSFTSAGGVSANNIARWDGTTWSALGSGITGVPSLTSVGAIVVFPNGDIVAGGDFTTAGGVGANNIARWNGTSWSALGSGTSGFFGSVVESLLTLPSGDLVAGGLFDSAGGATVNHIARWDGANWSALGTGVGGIFLPSTWTVQAMSLLPNGDIVAGGLFIVAGSVIVNCIARWDGTNWSALGTGVAGSPYYVSALTALPDGSLVAGGAFNAVGGVNANNIAKLTTTCPATATSFGAGCTGSGGLNVLTATTLPWTGSSFQSTATGIPANALVLRVLGLNSVSIPFSTIPLPSPAACTLLVSPDLLDLYLPTGGSVQMQVALPNSVVLAGQVFYEQVVPVELGAAGNITAFTGTNALTVTIGSF